MVNDGRHEIPTTSGQPAAKLPTWSGIVILVPRHLPFLREVLSDVQKQSRPFEQVIIVASGFVKSEDIRKLKKFVRESGFASSEVVLTPLAPAGANRNSGARVATCDYLVFMDVDDRFTHYRNQRLAILQAQYDFDLLLHAAFNFSNPDELMNLSLNRPSEETKGKGIWTTTELFSATFPNGKRDKTLEMGGANTNLQLGELSDMVPIHHGHAVVRRSCFETTQYHEKFFPRNEDGVFARDILFQRQKVVVTDEVLSAYRTYSSASNWRSKLVFNLWQPAVSKILSVLKR